MLLQSLYFSRFLPNSHRPLSSFDTHARWQSVTQSARSRWSYGKIEDCEQSNQQGTHTDANDTKTHFLPFSADSIIIVPWLISKTDFHKYAVTEVLSWNSRETLEQKEQVVDSSQKDKLWITCRWVLTNCLLSGNQWTMPQNKRIQTLSALSLVKRRGPI